MGRVIRAVRTERPGPVIRADEAAARGDAAALLTAARAEAAEIRAQAEARAQQLREQAVQEAQASLEAARARGHAEGTARAARELLDVAALRTRALSDAEREAQRAALMIAGKLLQQQLEVQPDAVQALVTPLFARVRHAQRLCVLANPQDASALAPLLATISARAELEGTVELVSDPTIARGGCIIRSGLGEIDARVETRLHELARALDWEPP